MGARKIVVGAPLRAAAGSPAPTCGEVRAARRGEEARLADVSAKPHAVPTGLSDLGACGHRLLRLFGGMMRLRLAKKPSIVASHSSFSTRSTPAACAATSCDRSSTVGPRPPLTMTA
jgi:hypothetical protein